MNIPLDQYISLSPTTGYVLSKLPSTIFNELKPLVDEISYSFSSSKEANKTLIGEIEHEYEFTLPNGVLNFVKEKVEIIGKSSPDLGDIHRLLGGNNSLAVPSLSYNGEAWINFQQKYEYNPPHSHSGVFSFVIWYQIPYYIKDELPYNSGQKRKDPNYSSNGDFNFLHSSGEKMWNHPLYIDKNKEGYMAIFPSLLTHYVNPFYSSDDYRITISGNIILSNHE